VGRNAAPDLYLSGWSVIWAITWIATILIVALLLGFIAYLALKKARPEDLPAVLRGLRDIADRLIWWLDRRDGGAGGPDSGASGTADATDCSATVDGAKDEEVRSTEGDLKGDEP
jgi:hypothetical protein